MNKYFDNLQVDQIHNKHMPKLCANVSNLVPTSRVSYVQGKRWRGNTSIYLELRRMCSFLSVVLLLVHKWSCDVHVTLVTELTSLTVHSLNE